MSSIEIVKRKITHLFQKDDQEILEKTVNDIHYVMSSASHLLKLYYLFDYESKYQNNNFIDDNKAFEISKDFIDICVSIVLGKKLSTRTKNLETQEKIQKKYEERTGDNKCLNDIKIQKDNDNFILYNKIKDVYIQTNMKPLKAKTSFSHILAYSKDTLLTVITTNITEHYKVYIKKYIQSKLILESYNNKESTIDPATGYIFCTKIVENKIKKWSI